MKSYAVKPIAMAIAGALILQGCATTGSTGMGEKSTGEKVGTATLVGAGAGLLCALMGGKASTCIAAAVVVGGVTYTIEVLTEQKKVKTAEQVNAEAKSAGLKVTKEVKPLPGSYTVAMQPATVKTGDKAVLVSNVSIYGKGSANIEQRIQLVDKDGKPLGKERTEPFKAEDGKAAGAYVSNATYQIPNGWSGQKFGFITKLMVDGKEVDSRNNATMTVLAEATGENSGIHIAQK